MLEDVYEPTEAGWKRYQAGKTYKMEFSLAKKISEVGYGYYIIKPEVLNK